MINPDRYAKPKKAGGKSGGPVHINIRLRKFEASGVRPFGVRPTVSRPTAQEVQGVLRLMLNNGAVPDGWEFAVIDWRNPKKASRGWIRGRVPEQDLEALGAVIRAALHECRIAIVRPTPKDVLQGSPNNAERAG